MSSHTTQRADIQGLRALAVVAVILFHVNSGWVPGGFVGVDVFLVISGYLITGIVLQKHAAGNFSFAAFYQARFWRIVPAYLVMLVVTSIVMAVLLVPGDFSTFKDSLLAALYFNSNNYFAAHSDYFAPQVYEQPLLHTWSLAVEMQFYLLLPALVVFIPRKKLSWVLVLLALGLLVHAAYQLDNGHRQSVYFSLAARIPEFLVGSLLATGNVGQSWARGTANLVAAIGLALVLSSFWLITEDASFPGMLAMPACIGVAMMIAAQNSFFSKVLSYRLLVWTGALSYSLYLWHWPVLASLRYFFETYFLPDLVVVFALVLTLGLSILSYFLVEVPCRDSRSRLRKLPAGVVLVASATAVVLFAGVWNGTIVKPLPDALTRYARQAEICHGNTLVSCSRGNKAAQKTILLIGDSHAAQLNHFADVLGTSLGVRFEVVSASSCVPIKGFDVDRIDEYARQSCVSQIAEVARRLEHADAVVLAGKWSYHMSSDQFRKSLSAFMAQMQSTGKPLLVLSQTPMLQSNVQRLHRMSELGLVRASQPDTEWQVANDRVHALTETYPKIRFLDLSRLNMFDDAPFYEGQIIYMDKHHLNEPGAAEYGQAAAPTLATWIREHGLDR